MTDSVKKLSRILNVSPEMLASLEKAMEQKNGRSGVFDSVVEKNEKAVDEMFKQMQMKRDGAYHAVRALREAIFWDERELHKIVSKAPGNDQFEQAAHVARKMARVSKGFFLKKEHLKKVFLERPPHNLLTHLGYATVDDLIANEDLTESFSALRFVETDEWMHETFDRVYVDFTPDDFEEREIEVRVLGEQWKEIAQKFVAKKHHNVSHLKEFGIIFLNPIAQTEPGKFLRD